MIAVPVDIFFPSPVGVDERAAVQGMLHEQHKVLEASAAFKLIFDPLEEPLQRGSIINSHPASAVAFRQHNAFPGGTMIKDHSIISHARIMHDL